MQEREVLELFSVPNNYNDFRSNASAYNEYYRWTPVMRKKLYFDHFDAVSLIALNNFRRIHVNSHVILLCVSVVKDSSKECRRLIPDLCSRLAGASQDC